MNAITSQLSGMPIDGTNGPVAILTAPSTLSAQNVRDALALALSVGVTPVAGSVDLRLPAALSGGKMVSALDSTERDAVATALLDLANGIETGYTARQALRLIAAAVAGKASGGPNSAVFRNLADTANRITTVTDASGNRSVVTHTP